MSESCETRESPQSDTNQHENVKYDSKARIWFFEGTLILDLDLDEWTEDEIRTLSRDDLVPSVVAHFGTDYFKKPPVPITYMEIGIDFSKASLGGCLGRTFTAPISGLLQAQSACAGTWNSWLQCPGSIEFIPYTDHELLELLRRRVEGWDIVARLGRRRRFVVQGRAWKFSATLVVPIPADADDYVDRAKEAFVATGGPRTLPTVLRYMTVLADLRSPISGATGLVSIPIKGYIQCRQCDSIRWLNWQPTFDYDVVHMGLASNAEFLADMAGLNSPSSSLFEIYTTGTLGLNNAGRMDKAIRASASLAFRSSCRDRLHPLSCVRVCRTAPSVQLPPAPLPRQPRPAHPGGREIPRQVRTVLAAESLGTTTVTRSCASLAGGVGGPRGQKETGEIPIRSRILGTERTGEAVSDTARTHARTHARTNERKIAIKRAQACTRKHTHARKHARTLKTRARERTHAH